MKTHELKLWPEFWFDIVSGMKTFEYRKNDRGFNAGDQLLLREYDPISTKYTGREIKAKITYTLGGYGIPKGYVIMSIEVIRNTREVINGLF